MNILSGWDIDITTGTQRIECLADLTDTNEMVPTGSHYPGPEELHDRWAWLMDEERIR